MNFLLAILLLCAGCAATVQPSVTLDPTVQTIVMPPLPPVSTTGTVRSDLAPLNPATNILFITIVNPANLPTNLFCDVLVSTDLVNWSRINTYAMIPGTNTFSDYETNAMKFYKFAQYRFWTSTN